MNGLRSFLYAFAKLLGDINSIKKGKVGKRLVNRAVGKATSRLFKK